MVSETDFLSCRYQKRVSNIIDDVLEWSPSLALSGMIEKQPVVNITEPIDNVTDSKSSDEKLFSSGDLDDETISNEEVEEVTENTEDSDHHQNI